MKTTIFPTIAKAIIVAISLSVLSASDAIAQNTVNESIASVQQAGDFAKLQAKLADFVAKIKKANKDELPLLYSEAKTIKEAIMAADLSESELAVVRKLFNDAIDLCKELN